MNSTDLAISLLLAAVFLMMVSLVVFHGIDLRTVYVAIMSVGVAMLAAIAIVVIGRMRKDKG